MVAAGADMTRERCDACGETYETDDNKMNDCHESKDGYHVQYREEREGENG